VPNLSLNPEERFYGSQPDAPMGLPVNLADRKILVERFHGLTELVDDASYHQLASEAQRRLADRGSLQDVEIEFGSFHTDFYPIVRLAVSWKPSLNRSSADAFVEVESVLLKEFDELLPRRSLPGVSPHGTHDVLTYAGRIHFNPDYWDLWKAHT
jgi:hypothetical protein